MQNNGVPASPSGHSRAEPEEVSVVPTSVPNAVGLSRTRLAELLYEHGGFVDHEGGFHAPDRDVPVWIEQSLTERHCGDCTKVAASCMNCHAQMALAQWDEFEAMIARAASGTLTEGGDAEQAPGDSLSGPTLEEGDAHD